ncbi:hypothetical protein BD413DRAFT_119608 [Trametes elegans]|nr:hypothetical protein BD413DRAFT_119608 [Trametes elegans]
MRVVVDRRRIVAPTRSPAHAHAHGVRDGLSITASSGGCELLSPSPALSSADVMIALEARHAAVQAPESIRVRVRARTRTRPRPRPRTRSFGFPSAHRLTVRVVAHACRPAPAERHGRGLSAHGRSGCRAGDGGAPTPAWGSPGRPPRGLALSRHLPCRSPTPTRAVQRSSCASNTDVSTLVRRTHIPTPGDQFLQLARAPVRGACGASWQRARSSSVFAAPLNALFSLPPTPSRLHPDAGQTGPTPSGPLWTPSDGQNPRLLSRTTVRLPQLHPACVRSSMQREPARVSLGACIQPSIHPASLASRRRPLYASCSHVTLADLARNRGQIRAGRHPGEAASRDCLRRHAQRSDLPVVQTCLPVPATSRRRCCTSVTPWLTYTRPALHPMSPRTSARRDRSMYVHCGRPP